MARWVWRAALALGGLLGSYVGMSCLLFVLGAHRASLSQQSEAWQPFSPLEPSHRLLIVAPHPDDEVLGCGGLIAEAVRRGALVRVVFLTSGDGYPAAATLLCRSTPTADDFLELGRLRMQEARRAAQALGLSPESLLFLGYPDRQLWRMATAGDKLLFAPTTRRSRVPYAEAFHPGAPYNAQSLAEDLRRVIADFQPTHIFVTHPLDDHPDHMVASLYVREAIAQASERGELLIAPKLFYYLIHRGDWPLPQGYYPDRLLAPPRGMAAEPWLCLPLDSELRQRKRRALYGHESQYALMARFLNSFLRSNELFLPEPLPAGSPFLRGNQSVAQNPVDDNPVLHLRPGADLCQIEVEPDSAGVRLQVATRRPLTTPLRLQITLIVVQSAGEWRTRAWFYTPERAQGFDGLVATRGERLHFWLPAPELRSAKRAYLLVQSRLYKVELDRSGIVAIPLPPVGGRAIAVVDAPSRAEAQQSAPSHTR